MLCDLFVYKHTCIVFCAWQIHIKMFKSGSGRKTDDGVWKYFKYEAASDNSVCSVRISDESDGSAKTCGVVLKGKNATNLKNHIRFKHKHLVPEVGQSNRIIKNEKLENINSTKVGVFSLRIIIDNAIVLNFLKFALSFKSSGIFYMRDKYFSARL